MTVLVVGSLHGSPGATTVALGLAGCLRDSVVVEADCDGGVLGARFGLPREPGVITLAADREGNASGSLTRHARLAPVGVPVIVGPESPDHATWLWKSAGPQLAESLGQHDGFVIVDAGRFSPSAPTIDLFGRHVTTAIVTRPRTDELAIVSAKLATVSTEHRPLIILVGERPYDRAEVAAELGCDVVGVVADDARAASTLWDGGSPRLLARSPFSRSLRSVADALVDRLERRALRADATQQAVTP